MEIYLLIGIDLFVTKNVINNSLVKFYQKLIYGFSIPNSK